MREKTIVSKSPYHPPASGRTIPTFLTSWFYRLARRAVFSRLASLQQGHITIVESGQRYELGAQTPRCLLRATVTIHDPRTYTSVALGGTVGGGEAYVRGFWSCNDLTALIRIFVINRDMVDGLERGFALGSRPLLQLAHWMNRNSRTGSRRNIAAHYDLGNDFYRLMLDETMMYSCAYFDPPASLAEASIAKNERICRKLALSASDHVLEIGTGWGGFAIHAASRYGCRVTTATISQHQYDLATKLIRDAGLSERVTVLFMDYRDLPELGRQFDKLVSIEMIEALGYEYYDAFFNVCTRMLKPAGLMLIQCITIDERFYERAKRSVDFIQRSIFPGSCIPSVSALTQASAKVGHLGLIHLEDIGVHYPPTLRAWRRNIAAELPKIKALGYQPEFIRLWDFYLSYCEGGFIERSISTVHLLFCMPNWRPHPVGC